MESDEKKLIWVEEKLETWVAGEKRLDKFARALPQTAYARLTMSIQKEWQFAQRTTTSVGTLFAPLEAALTENFIASLLGGWREDVIDYLRKRITWGMKRAGIRIPDPTHTSPKNFETSKKYCEVITDSPHTT